MTRATISSRFPHLQGYSQQGMGLFGCEEWRIAMNRMELLLTQAEKLNLYATNAYIAAKSYYEDNTGFWGTPVVLVGSSCTSAMAEINSRLSELSKVVSSSGNAPVIPAGSVPSPESGLEMLPGLVKWVAIGAIAIGGAITLGHIVKVVGIFAPRRKLSGYSKSKRRTRRTKRSRR